MHWCCCRSYQGATPLQEEEGEEEPVSLWQVRLAAVCHGSAIFSAEVLPSVEALTSAWGQYLVHQVLGPAAGGPRLGAPGRKGLLTGSGRDAWHFCLYVWLLWNLSDSLACMWGGEPCRLDSSCL